MRSRRRIKGMNEIEQDEGNIYDNKHKTIWCSNINTHLNEHLKLFGSLLMDGQKGTYWRYKMVFVFCSLVSIVMLFKQMYYVHVQVIIWHLKFSCHSALNIEHHLSRWNAFWRLHFKWLSRISNGNVILELRFSILCIFNRVQCTMTMTCVWGSIQIWSRNECKHFLIHANGSGWMLAA